MSWPDAAEKLNPVGAGKRGPDRAGTAAETPLGPEWELLELLCRGADVDRQRQALDRLVRDGQRWGELVDHALRHRMLPMLAHASVETGVVDRMPVRLAEHLHTVLAVNRYRRRIWYAELGRVVDALAAAGIDALARKGAAYESTIYAGNGSRWLGDLDLLVRLADQDAVVAGLERLGYRCGLFDFRAGELIPFRRADLIKYRLNPDHLPTYTRITGDPLVPVIEVDCATSLTWARAPYTVDVDEVLASREWITVDAGSPVSIPRASSIYQFLDTVLHLFREAWFEWWLEKEQDVDLMKFGDVIRLSGAYRPALSGGRFRDLVVRHSVTEPVCWVLEHLDRTFDADLTRSLSLAGMVTETFLASAAGSGPEVPVWHADMRARLSARDRRRLQRQVGDPTSDAISPP